MGLRGNLGPRDQTTPPFVIPKNSPSYPVRFSPHAHPSALDWPGSLTPLGCYRLSVSTASRQFGTIIHLFLLTPIPHSGVYPNWCRISVLLSNPGMSCLLPPFGVLKGVASSIVQTQWRGHSGSSALARYKLQPAPYLCILLFVCFLAYFFTSPAPFCVIPLYGPKFGFP